MAQVTITINSREYGIACEDGQEFRILQLSRILDEKAQILTQGSNQISENMLLAMIALLLADELSEIKKNKNTQPINNNELSAKLQEIDEQFSQTIKNIDDKLKVLAKDINLL